MDLRNGYAVIDLEMTGSGYRSGLIIEIAVGIAVPNQSLTTERVLVKIDRPIPKRITKLTGITDGELASSGISIDDALSWFAKKTSQLPLVGHDILRSDFPYLREAARRHRDAVENGLYPELIITEEEDLPIQRFIDTAALYKGYKLGEYQHEGETHQEYAVRVVDLPNQGIRIGLAAACQDLGITTSRIRAHRATADVIQNQKLFEKLLEVNPPE